MVGIYVHCLPVPIVQDEQPGTRRPEPDNEAGSKHRGDGAGDKDSEVGPRSKDIKAEGGRHSYNIAELRSERRT